MAAVLCPTAVGCHKSLYAAIDPMYNDGHKKHRNRRHIAAVFAPAAIVQFFCSVLFLKKFPLCLNSFMQVSEFNVLLMFCSILCLHDFFHMFMMIKLFICLTSCVHLATI